VFKKAGEGRQPRNDADGDVLRRSNMCRNQAYLPRPFTFALHSFLVIVAIFLISALQTLKLDHMQHKKSCA